MGFIRKFFDGFGKRKSKAEKLETLKDKKLKRVYIKKKKVEPKKEEKKNLSLADQKHKRNGNVNRKKNKIVKYSRKGSLGKINKISRRNTVTNRNKKTPLLKFNKELDTNERKHRDSIREVRRQAKGLKPYKK